MTNEERLLQVKGVGPATLEKLKELGIETPEQLAVYQPDHLKEFLRITLKQAKDMINSAKDMVFNKTIKPMTLKELIEYRKNITKRISTGSVAIDNVLLGGIPTEAITIISGEWGTGKTQMCIQLAVNTIKMGRKVAWIETEPMTFSADRLIEVAKASNVTIDLENDLIFVRASEVPTPSAQFLAYELVDRAVSENKNFDLGLLVVDSFTAKFRSYYVGREQLPARSQELSRHLGYLEVLASKYNTAIVLTSQVMDTPDAGSQLHNITKTGTRKEYVGGNILKHSGTYMLTVSKRSKEEWELIVADAPDVPQVSVPFRILSSGIRDVVTKGVRQ